MLTLRTADLAREVVLVRGKGGRERMVPLSEPARAAAAAMLAQRAGSPPSGCSPGATRAAR